MNKDIVNYFVKEINELHSIYNKKLLDCINNYEEKIRILEKEIEELKSFPCKAITSYPVKFSKPILPPLKSPLQKSIKTLEIPEKKSRFKNLPPLRKH
jgi:hypothetical protein